MFEFEDVGEIIKLIIPWLCFASIMPAYWWFTHDEAIIGQMFRSREGWVYFALSFLLALVFRPVSNKLSRSINRC